MSNGLNTKIFQSCVFERRPGRLIRKGEELILIKLMLN